MGGRVFLLKHPKRVIVSILKNRFLRCINSGLHFTEEELDLKVRHNIINITIVLAVIGLIFGTTLNLFKDDTTGAIFDITAIFVLMTTAIFLRIKKEHFELIATVFAIEFLLIFDLLIVISDPSDLKHIWLLTYPALIFFYKGDKSWLLWIGALVGSLFLTKLQPFFPIQYSLRDIVYLSVVLLIMTVVIYFYKSRIDVGNQMITRQKEQLEGFAKELENKVKEKTKELQELNTQLEQKVEDKATELVKKDEMILAQSRQAAMGEMISMIAHQWRQPLSTITLQISSIKINSMLGKASVEETNDALERISQTIIYLSETIDDFQTFFNPNKAKEVTCICELIERAISFTELRLKLAHIHLDYLCNKRVETLIHSNEFTQVIINIINNAIDVLLEREIKNPIIHIENIVKADVIEIRITDNGGGVKDAIINNIFEPYFSTKGKNGTGLGLYMSKIIIEKELSGTLKAKNIEGGAEFTIEIPYLDPCSDKEKREAVSTAAL